MTLRLGRHEVAFGAGRLISAAEGLNVRRSFDGARLIVKERRMDVERNGDAARLRRYPACSTIVANPDCSPGAQAETGHGPGSGPVISPSITSGLDGEPHDSIEDTADSIRHTGGIRIWGSAGRMDYDQEVIVQLGTFGQEPIQAYAIASIFAGASLRQRAARGSGFACSAQAVTVIRSSQS